MSTLECFYFNHTATTEIYTLSLQRRSSDLSPLIRRCTCKCRGILLALEMTYLGHSLSITLRRKCANSNSNRSEEHTSELQSQSNLVCRLLLEKKKKNIKLSTNNEDYAKLLN